jgi:hypothetical protein
MAEVDAMPTFGSELKVSLSSCTPFPLRRPTGADEEGGVGWLQARQRLGRQRHCLA